MTSFRIGSSAHSFNSVQSLDLPAGVGARAGDWCVIVVSTDTSVPVAASAPGFSRLLEVGASGNMATDIIGRVWDGSAGPITITIDGAARSFTATGLWFEGADAPVFGIPGKRSGSGAQVTAPGIGTVPPGAGVWALFGDRSIAATAAESSLDIGTSWGIPVYANYGNPALSAGSGISTVVLVQGSAQTTDNTATFPDTSGNAWGVVMALPAANDCWVWDGAAEVPANVTVWNGTAEVPADLEVV